jgi:predicted amidohydrolase YtcJ
LCYSTEKTCGKTHLRHTREGNSFLNSNEANLLRPFGSINLTATLADLALIHGKILTMSPSQPQAEAIAVKAGKIIQVGTNTEIQRLIGKETQVIELRGRTVIPGLIDTHVHVADLGKLLTWLDFSQVSSFDKALTVLSERAKETPKGKWVLGRCLDESSFAKKRFPSRFDLDSVSPLNPVVIYHKCGQICVANTLALKAAQISKQTPQPEGGEILKDSRTGEPTGVLRDNATNLVWCAIPELTDEEQFNAALLACQKIVEAGISTVHWIILSAAEIPLIQKLVKQDCLPFRVYVIVPLNLIDSAKSLELPAQSKVTLGAAMIDLDGYLASRTAALLDPYSDLPESKGKLLCTKQQLRTNMLRALKLGFQPVIHAMGDGAVQEVLDAIENLPNATDSAKVRIRIEQAAVLGGKPIERLQKNRLIVSVQPKVVASEFSVWSAEKHLGPQRAKWLFPLRTLISKGVRVAGGSDSPMEPLNPFDAIQTAVCREVFPEQQVSLLDALKMYTVDAAYSSCQEEHLGSIEQGKLADLTVLSSDPREVAFEKLGSIKAELTIIDGKIVNAKPDSDVCSNC